MIKSICALSVLLCLVCSACSDSKQEIKKKLLASSNAEKSNIYANKARELGQEGIPIFLEVISASIEKQDNLANYAKLMLGVKNLNDLAREGIYSQESVPVLLNVLVNQRYIADSFITADTIRIITGLDVGYNLDFVKSYTPSDEPRRKEMISRWESMLIESK